MTKKVEIGDSVVLVTFGHGPHQAIAAAKAVIMKAVDAQALTGQYTIATRGRSAKEIADEVDRITVHHFAKSKRIMDADPLLGQSFVVSGETYTWKCITIRERGTCCEMYAACEGGGKRHVMEIIRNDPASFPSNDELESLMTDRIRQLHADDAAHAQKLKDLQGLLGG